MLSAIPLLVAAGAVMAVIISKMASRGQNAYAKAATVVEQTIGSIRTVCCRKLCLSSVCFFGQVWFII